jgi:lipopolysaccharide/colanic/teichoic acid biosynthesis glycosyltransferase
MLKRYLDILGAVLGLLVLAVPLAVMALLVRWKLGSPVLFVQERPGLLGRVFRIYKFRTMTDRRDADGLPLSDAARLTPFGRWLRATSLDELPELFNVLRGDMSFVGPRPLLVEYLPLYSERQARRHEVRPGITGWSQVNGRNAVDWDQRLEMDVWYVDHRNLWLDFRILLQTVVKVIRRDGISQDGQATMERFRGSDG